MLRLTTLDKKLFVVQHKMTPQQLMELKLPEDELKKLIQQNIYNKVVQLLFQASKVQQRTTDDGFVWEYKMFMFTERDFLNTLLEVCELSEEDRQDTITKLKELLGLKN